MPGGGKFIAGQVPGGGKISAGKMPAPGGFSTSAEPPGDGHHTVTAFCAYFGEKLSRETCNRGYII